MGTWLESLGRFLTPRANWDIAGVNLACALELPGVGDLDVAGCLRTLDDWAARARQNVERMAEVFRRDPSAYNNSWALFRAVDLATCLKRGLGIAYNMEAHEQPDEVFFADARNLFIHEVIQNRKGTCASLPVLFVAVGRRLGYPLKLVQGNRHLFARWEERGERFNIEITCPGGMNTYPDEYYLHFPFETTPAEVEKYGFLKSLSPQQELSLCLGKRGQCWLQNRDYAKALDAYYQAYRAFSDLWGEGSCGVQVTLKRWRQKLEQLGSNCFPPMKLTFQRRVFSHLPVEMEMEIIKCDAVEQLLENSDFGAKWREAIRKNGNVPPKAPPGHLVVRYPTQPGEKFAVTFCAEPLPTGANKT